MDTPVTDTTKNALLITLTVEVLEDLHTGSGTGGGDVDALVQRDRYHRPVIRATHLKGLLREAGEELIRLEQTTTEKLNTLLGSEGGQRGALRLTSLFVQQSAQTPPMLILGSTQRVANGRAPQADTLRFIEHVAAGTCFTATLRLADAAQLCLLETLLKRIDRIGGGRNRGTGLVKLAWQAQPHTPATPPVMSETGCVVRLVLRNLEPLCLPATGYPGNLIQSHSFIRGQTLRGALIAWAIQTGRAEHLKLFERMAVGDALPLPEGCHDAEQVLPIPLSILTDKPSGCDSDVPWWASKTVSASAFDSLGELPDTYEKRKRPGTHEYLCRYQGSDNWQRYSPTMRVRLRNATPKRDSTEDTQLFSLEEIAEDTGFQAELRCADEQTVRDFLTAFAPLLTGTDWLGIGRGGQPVVIAAVKPAPSPILPPTLGNDWTLTLTSDAIVRGERLERLGFVDNLSLNHLCQLAGIAAGDDWKIITDVAETTVVHGFNAVTGLTRAPALALRRGSCWRIQGPGSAVLAQALFEKGAIGERTHEGYGRFLLNVQPIAPDALGKPAGQSVPLPDNRDELLLTWAQALAKDIHNHGPSLSQLQWLRSQAGAVEMQGQFNALLDEIAQAPKRRPQGGKAWEHFPHRLLREALENCQTLDEKRRLVAYLVQWRVLDAKKSAANKEAS